MNLIYSTWGCRKRIQMFRPQIFWLTKQMWMTLLQHQELELMNIFQGPQSLTDVSNFILILIMCIYRSINRSILELLQIALWNKIPLASFSFRLSVTEKYWWKSSFLNTWSLAFLTDNTHICPRKLILLFFGDGKRYNSATFDLSFPLNPWSILIYINMIKGPFVYLVVEKRS